MSKRGIKNFNQVIVTDLDYDITDVGVLAGSSIVDMITTLMADASSVRFDTAEGDIPMQKEANYSEELGEEDNDGEKETIPSLLFVGVGLDEEADNPKRVICKELKGKTKNVFYFDKNTGTVDKLLQYKLNMNRTRPGNGKELYNFEAMSTKDGNQSDNTIPLVTVIP